MDKHIQRILDSISEFEKTPEGVAEELRMSIVTIIMCRLRDKGWDMADLARAANMREKTVMKVLAGSHNARINVFARLLHAVSARARAEECARVAPNL